MGKLAIATGGQSFAVPVAGSLSVGRAPQCDILIDSPAVSRFHARIGTAQGKLVVVDVGSRNGVMVNGARVAGTQFLQLGDVITIGEQSLTVVDDSSASDSKLRALVPRSTPSVALRRTDALSSVYGVYLETLHEALATQTLGDAVRAAKHLCESLDTVTPATFDVTVLERITDALIRTAVATGEAVWIDRLLWARRRLEQPLDTSRTEAVAAHLWNLTPGSDAGRRAYIEWMTPRATRVADRVALRRLGDAVAQSE
jgi:predicted component of type VI protein secretion system